MFDAYVKLAALKAHCVPLDLLELAEEGRISPEKEVQNYISELLSGSIRGWRQEDNPGDYVNLDDPNEMICIYELSEFPHFVFGKVIVSPDPYPDKRLNKILARLYEWSSKKVGRQNLLSSIQFCIAFLKS